MDLLSVPLLDSSGNVIGVVVAKLDAIKLAQVTGDIPQNVNFAIKSDIARAFLEANQVSARLSTSLRPIDSVGVAAIAKSIIVAVECEDRRRSARWKGLELDSSGSYFFSSSTLNSNF